MSAGIGFEDGSGRDTTGLGNAWGGRGGSIIRAIFNAVIPVTVIERVYGELDGSIFGLTAGTSGFPSTRPGIVFFSDSRDWELHALNIWYPIMGTVGGTGGPTEYRVATHLFTPAGGYNPVELITAGPFGPQLVNTTQFDQGTVRAFSGTNAINNPAGFGWLLAEQVQTVGTLGSGTVDQVSDAHERNYLNVLGDLRNIGWDKKLTQAITFPRPIRVRRNRLIAVNLNMLNATASYTPVHSLQVSALYSELPNPRGSYRT